MQGVFVDVSHLISEIHIPLLFASGDKVRTNQLMIKEHIPVTTDIRIKFTQSIKCPFNYNKLQFNAFKMNWIYEK